MDHSRGQLRRADFIDTPLLFRLLLDGMPHDDAIDSLDRTVRSKATNAALATLVHRYLCSTLSFTIGWLEAARCPNLTVTGGSGTRLYLRQISGLRANHPQRQATRATAR